MSCKLKVIEPFFNLEVGDVLEPSNDGKEYVCSVNEANTSTDDNGNEKSFNYTSSLKLSASYIDELLKEGYLEKMEDDKAEFKNVFTEIDNLLDDYTSRLSKIDETYKDKPVCLKVEEQTVLNNLITVLTHLRNLKK